MTELNVNPEGLRATAGILGELTAQSTTTHSGDCGPGSQVSITAAQHAGTYTAAWDTDERGYYADMADALTAASAGFETTDEQGGHKIDGAV